METIINVKNTIRNFLRKYDEFTTPVLRFIWAIIVFQSIKKLFGYSDLAGKGGILLLLAALCALLPDGFIFIVSGLLIMLNAFSVSMEAGFAFVLLYVAMYCIYLRFFPKSSGYMLIIPICFMIKLPYMVPIVIGMTAGIVGAVPAAFGVVLYYFSIYLNDLNLKLTTTASADSEIKVLTFFVESFMKNKEMLLFVFAAAITIAVVAIIYRLSFPYAWYVAIGVGGLFNLFSFMIAGSVLKQNVDMGSVMLGSLLGMIVALIIQFFKGIVDYKKTERVQFEDDDYYYYVKAIPKKEKKDKNDREDDEEPVKRRSREGAGSKEGTPRRSNSERREGAPRRENSERREGAPRRDNSERRESRSKSEE